MVDTFEKMDAINPTFDRVAAGVAVGWWSNEDKIHVFFNFNHLFPTRAICLISQYPS
jgi:hypothetical protein